jgi:hypothetical protein
MWFYFKDKWETHKLNKELAKINETYRNEIKIAKKNEESREKIQDRQAMWNLEASGCFSQIVAIETKKLRRKANRYNLPFPDYNDEKLWEIDAYGERYLNNKARYELAKKIRQEFKDRVEIWTPIIAALIALAGVIVGSIF